MRRNFSIFSFLLLLVFTISNSAVLYSEELTGHEIVRRSDDLMRGNTLQGSYVMTVVTPNWRRSLELDVWEGSRDKVFIYIKSPAKESGTSTLRIKESMWNYIPKVERTIKIPPSMMFQSWMGSDFTNDDLVKESSIVNDYTHSVLQQEAIGEDAAYKIQLNPKPEAAVTWGKLVFWIRKDDFVPLREEYYSEQGKLIKVLEYSDIKKMSDRVIPTFWKMTSRIKEGCYTTIKVVNVEYNKQLEDSIFTLENLKRTR